MTLSLRSGLALLATTAVLAGCSTAPTITVPNPLAALNGVFAPAPRVAAAPSYTPTPGARYEQVDAASYGAIVPSYTSAPSYGSASYGAVDQAYSLPSIDTRSYSAGSVTTLGEPSYSAASSFEQGTYTLGNGIQSASAPSYSTGVPTFGTLASQAPSYSMAAPAMEASPSYSMAAPVMETASYASQVTTYSEPVTAMPSYSQGYGMAQPVQASGTTYDLTVPSPMQGMDPAAGLTIDSTSYATYPAPAASMGGSFQVTAPTTGGGVATYSAPTVVDGGTFTY